VFPCLSS